MLEKGTHKLSRKISNGSFGELLGQLKYKCKWSGKKFYQIDPYYPSSQICSVCEYQNRKVKDLSIRKWECPKCHYVHDRDANASINIMWEGIKMYMKEVYVN